MGSNIRHDSTNDYLNGLIQVDRYFGTVAEKEDDDDGRQQTGHCCVSPVHRWYKNALLEKKSLECKNWRIYKKKNVLSD